MPPPTAGDSWLSGRRFGVVIDAGSSGSRLQLYSWRDAALVRDEAGPQVYNSLPTVEKGTKDGVQWISKTEPGLSSFADNLDGIPAYLSPLLEYARDNVPPSLQPQTPLFLLATAGMRLLQPDQQADVLSAACDFLRFHSHFRVDPPSSAGPCGSSVRIITGEEEGVFGWIAVNYLMDGFSQDETTYGFLDMGGASTQIAFEPSKIEAQKTQNLLDIRLRLLGGQEIVHKVFTTTWLGYGTNQARERYVASAISAADVGRQQYHEDASPATDVVQDPCLPKGLQLRESPFQLGSSDAHSRQPHTLHGTGSFEACLERVSPLLNKNAPCPDTQCLFNGVYVPPIDFTASHFIGVSEYWYSSEHVFNLGGPYDFVQYERAASSFCSLEWEDILLKHIKSKADGHLGGDGQVEQSGRVVGAGVWNDGIEISRLEMQCFKAAWIVNVLHDGLGMPRIVDPGGNNTSVQGDRVQKEAGAKGLGRPTFQSVDEVDGTAISWTLGKMVLEASNEIAPLRPTTQPLPDPLEDVAESSPIQPIRPPFWGLGSLDDKISGRLPGVLTPESLGFSLVGRAINLLLVCLIIWVAYRLRHHIQGSLRSWRYRRGASGSFLMEEGESRTLNSHAPLRSQTPLRRLASYVRTRIPADPTSPHRPRLFNMSGGSMPNVLVSTPRSTLTISGGLHNPSHLDARHTGDVPLYSRSSSPSEPSASGSLSSLSRSRNSSMMNLSTLVPRQPSSRPGGGTQSPSGGTFHDDH